MALKLWQDGVDVASVASIPENGNFKCVGNSYLAKKDPFLYVTNQLILKSGFSIDLYTGSDLKQITNRADITFDPASVLDIGEALEFGQDYYDYIVLTGVTPNLVVSKNTTYPNGATATNSRKIGGFHYGTIRKVSNDGKWIPIDSTGAKFGSSGTKWQDNVTSGIIPNSVWDLKNRPKNFMPGMVKIGTFWETIYQPSINEVVSFMGGTNGLSIKGGSLQSRYGQLPATGSEGLNQYNFNELAMAQGMRLLSYDEWMAGAFGSPQGEDGSNNYGWTKTTNSARTFTGCSVNTSNGKHDTHSGVKPYAVSARNVCDCAGNVYEWTKTYSIRQDSTSWNWQDKLGANQGQAYLPFGDGLSAFRCGGNWNSGVHCGPRTVYLDYYPCEQLGAQQPFEVALRLRYLVAAFYLVSVIIVYIGARFVFNLDRKTVERMNRELGRL